MVELTVDSNQEEQRLDRFLKKYLNQAPSAFIYRMIRKKNIKVNGAKTSPETMLKLGDVVNIYLSDETLKKMRKDRKQIKHGRSLQIAYEDDNFIIINKPAGLITHCSMKYSSGYEDNVVDRMLSYLQETGKYIPRKNSTFTPALVNRLDRNTSGILIGCINYRSVKAFNEAIRNQDVERYYLAVVKGVAQSRTGKAYIRRNEDKNITSITRNPNTDDKLIETSMKPIADNGEYSLVEVKIETGRTHQIRTQLPAWGFPIVGDRKYGDKDSNELATKWGLNRQWLHAYKVVLNGLKGDMSYANGMIFESPIANDLVEISDTIKRGEIL
ncbi:MAG: RluA family pseudouridine synthase [Tissierellia bacterium]|nr:RluA family pseudouridine synthase [Tissierellia bacterium]